MGCFRLLVLCLTLVSSPAVLAEVTIRVEDYSWSNPQLRKLRHADYPAFLAACGEQVALSRFCARAYQLVPRFIRPFNEPTSGNGELAGGSTRKSPRSSAPSVNVCGRRGLPTCSWLRACEETVARSLAVAEAVLADGQARPFVGAIGYHCYLA